MSNAEAVIFWKVGDPRPSELNEDPVVSCMVPKPSVWISVDHKIALLEGYNAATQSPPTLMFAAQALPPAMLAQLQESKLCSISVATMREQNCLFDAACYEGQEPRERSFEDLGLTRCQHRPGYPPTVQGSPVQMYCRLLDIVPLTDDQQMVLVEAESIVICGEILASPKANTGRSVLAWVDAELMRPVASMGNGRFVSVDHLHLMSRPRPKKEADGSISSWESDPFVGKPNTTGPGGYEDIEYKFRDDQSHLGYNPTTAVVVPRPIGWISTYREYDSRIPHLAPYSYFAHVGRGNRHMVAFSGYRRGVGNDGKKDAQLDAEIMGCFSTNMVTLDLTTPMNYSAAELTRTESEFDLSGLSWGQAQLVDSPIVLDSPLVMECRYVKTVNVADFSIVIGEVVGIRISKSILTEGTVDVSKLKPVTRLGYTDEYAVLDSYIIPPIALTNSNPALSENGSLSERTHETW